LTVGLAFALALGPLNPSSGLAAGSQIPAPFAGAALWVTQIAPPQTGRGLVAEAATAGARTLYVKAAEGSSPEAQFSTALVSEMRAAGATVCAWTFAYGQDPSAEAAAAVAAVDDGAQCLVVDAESQYDKLYGAAQLFVRTLRSQLGASFPIGLASEAEILRHPTFPYSVFLGPGGFNVFLPEIYWLEIGVSVDAAYAASIGGDSIYGRPILPVGQLFGSLTPAEVTRFRGVARAYGSPGLSFFDLDSAQPQALAALGAPLPHLTRRATVAPTLRAGGCGDEIVQAQELLDAAGAHLPVGGYFGAETARAVTSFQARHRLPPSGVLTPATWRALLRLRPREPSWASAPPICEQ
jgi:putative peptidoglycan binding protein